MLKEDLGIPRLRMAVRAALTGGSWSRRSASQTLKQRRLRRCIDGSSLAGSGRDRFAHRHAEQISISPVTFVCALDIQRTGVTRVEDF